MDKLIQEIEQLEADLQDYILLEQKQSELAYKKNKLAGMQERAKVKDESDHDPEPIKKKVANK